MLSGFLEKMNHLIYFLTVSTLFFLSYHLQAAPWTSPANLSKMGENASSPQIVIDRYGNATAVWTRFNGKYLVIQSSVKMAGKNWQQNPETISSPDKNAFKPSLCVDSIGNITVVWESIIDEHSVIQAKSRPFGGKWQKDPQTISLLDSHSVASKVAVDSAGNIIVIWECHENHQTLIQSVLKPFNGRWQNLPYTLSLLEGHATNPQLVIDAEDNITVVWQFSKEDQSEIHSISRMAQKDWSESIEVIASSERMVSFPQIAADSFCDLTVVWNEFDGNRGAIRAAERPYGGNWKVYPECISDPQKNALWPQLVVDSIGNATAVWESFCEKGNTHVFCSTKTYGRNWQSTPNSLSFTGTRNTEPRLAADAEGNIILVWRNINGHFSSIYSLIKPANKGWNFPFQTLSWPMRIALMPQLFLSLTGEAIAVWVMHENLSFIQESSLLGIN